MIGELVGLAVVVVVVVEVNNGVAAVVEDGFELSFLGLVLGSISSVEFDVVEFVILGISVVG